MGNTITDGTLVAPGSLPNLATAADLTTYGYDTAASAMLARASVRVRAYTRQDITSGSSTVSLRHPFLLPQRPVVSITSVAYTDADGETVTLESTTDYTVEGQRLICNRYKDRLLTVTYTHGHATLPRELVELVCSIAYRLHTMPHALKSGVQSESADGESLTWGANAYSGVSELTPDEKRVLDRLFPHSRKVPSVATTM